MNAPDANEGFSRSIGGWAWIPATLLALGLGSIAMLVGSNWIRERLIAGRIDLVRAVGEVQTRSAIAHLWVEEMVSGDDHYREEIADNLRQGIALLEQMLELEQPGTSWLASDDEDPQLRDLTLRTRENLVLFTEMSYERQSGFDRGDDVGVGSPIDVRYDAVFIELLEDLRAMESVLERQLARAESRSGQLFRTIVLVWIVLVGLAVFGIWSRERRRREAEIALHESEAQLLQAQKLEAVGRLAGGIAHDINNHLAAITGQCELVKLGVGDEPVASRMDSILSTAGRSSELIKRLLAFSRQQPVVRETVDVNELVNGLEGMLMGLIGEGIALRTRLSNGLHNVAMDPSQLEQILLNLVVNSKDAMPRGGSLTIETHNESIEPTQVKGPDAPASGRWVVIAVADTGSGVPPEIQQRIFEPFFTTKDTASGSGLGLATTHGIVRQNRGHVTVESSVGQGSVFRVFLPRTTEHVRGADADVETKTTLAERGASILLVEDNDELRRSTREILVSLGYTLTTAANAQDAVALFSERVSEFDLLVTDIIMPGMDGKQLADLLREQKDDLRVLFVSGYAGTIILERGVDEHGLNFLPKPFSAAALSEKVKSILVGKTL